MTGVVMEAAKHLLTLCSEIGDLASDVRHSSSSCAMFAPCCSLACLLACYGLLFRGNYFEDTLGYSSQKTFSASLSRSKQLALADHHCGRCDL